MLAGAYHDEVVEEAKANEGQRACREHPRQLFLAGPVGPIVRTRECMSPQRRLHL